MLARWLSVIATYDFEVEHRKGVNHSNADGLSRLRCKSFNCPSCDEFSGIDKKDDGFQDKPEKVTQMNALTGCPSSTDNGPTNWMDTWGARPIETLAERRSRYLHNATNESIQPIQTSRFESVQYECDLPKVNQRLGFIGDR